MQDNRTKPLQFTLPALLAVVTMICLLAASAVAPGAFWRFCLGVGSGVAVLATPLAAVVLWLAASRD